MDRPKPPDLPPHPHIMAAGLDEAGRGCLAGPVVAAAVILPPWHNLDGLADSKALSPGKRENLAPQIKKHAIAWSIGVVWQKRIDEINILQATFEAMAKAVGQIKITPLILLVDGNRTIPGHVLSAFCQLPPAGQKAIVGGDAVVPAISAASIIAKTFRDRLMLALARKWPAYGFERHKGYGTKAHYEALREFGPCPFHRMSFRGVADKPAQVCQLPLQKMHTPQNHERA